MSETDLGRLQASLAGAPDMQVSRVVAMVDAMPDRGEADALIAPLRSRLALMRPARRVSFTRLLFTPLNPVILGTSEWRRSNMGVPRAALACLGKAVLAALPASSDWCGAGQCLLPAMGRTLWPQASAVLDELAMPRAWPTDTGLTSAEYRAVTGTVACVLREAADVEACAAQGRPPDDALLRAMLSNGHARVAGALDTLVAVLLDQMPSPVRVLAIAADVAGGDHVLGRALDRLVDQLSQRTGDVSGLRATAYEAARIAVLLSSLESAAVPGRRERLDLIRRKADSSCRVCFERAFTQTMAPLKAGGGAPLDDDTIATMEARARDLRWFETAAP